MKKIKTFPDKQKLKEFITIRHVLQERQKEFLQVETRMVRNNVKTYVSIKLTGKGK